MQDILQRAIWEWYQSREWTHMLTAAGWHSPILRDPLQEHAQKHASSHAGPSHVAIARHSAQQALCDDHVALTARYIRDVPLHKLPSAEEQV